jgi:hypothetical protein
MQSVDSRMRIQLFALVLSIDGVTDAFVLFLASCNLQLLLFFSANGEPFNGKPASFISFLPRTCYPRPRPLFFLQLATVVIP